MVTTSVFPVICSHRLDESRDFYRNLLRFDVVFENGWYTSLRAPDEYGAQVALVGIGHDSVPAPFSIEPAGVLVTIAVDDVDRVHARAAALGLVPVVTLRDEDFGQRHFMVTDPNGLLVDVVEPILPSRSFLQEVARWRRGHR